MLNTVLFLVGIAIVLVIAYWKKLGLHEVNYSKLKFWGKKPEDGDVDPHSPHSHGSSTGSWFTKIGNFILNTILVIVGIVVIFYAGRWAYHAIRGNIYTLEADGLPFQYSVSDNMSWTFESADGEIEETLPDGRVFLLREDHQDYLIKESSRFVANTLNRGDQRSPRGAPSGVYEFTPRGENAELSVKTKYIK